MSLRKIEFYEDETGTIPFLDWFETLEERVKGKIDSRLNRLEQGTRGVYRNLEGGLFELKIDFGPGYRIYCGEKEGVFYIVLGGGDKSSQKSDIKCAQTRWAECRGAKWRENTKTTARTT